MKEEKDLSVLIIEDQDMFRKLAFQIFEGCDRVMAVNAKEGAAKFKEYCPDITLLDIGLPDKSGLDLLPVLLEHDPEAFVVMLTASRLSTDVENAKENGAAGYITKPFTYNKVDECIVKYKEYKEKLSRLSPDERAEHIVKTLRVEAVDEDIKKQQEMEKQAKQAKQIMQDQMQTWNILFVDDYPTNKIRAGKQLKKLGCTVQIAGSGEEVLELIKKEQFNLIFLDTKMPPGIDGYKTTETIRAIEEKKEKHCIIIGMVEYSDEIEDKLWETAGMDDYVKKPAKFFQLREMIEKYINLELQKRNT